MDDSKKLYIQKWIEAGDRIDSVHIHKLNSTINDGEGEGPADWFRRLYYHLAEIGPEGARQSMDILSKRMRSLSSGSKEKEVLSNFLSYGEIILSPSVFSETVSYMKSNGILPEDTAEADRKAAEERAKAQEEARRKNEEERRRRQQEEERRRKQQEEELRRRQEEDRRKAPQPTPPRRPVTSPTDGYTPQQLEAMHHDLVNKRQAYAQETVTKKRKSRRWIKILLSLLAIAGILGLAYTLWGDKLREMLNSDKSETVLSVDNLEGQWTGTFEGRDATLEMSDIEESTLIGTLTVQYKKAVTESLTGSFSLTADTLRFDNYESNGNLQGCFRGYLNASGNLYRGEYENYKSHYKAQFEFAKTGTSEADSLMKVLDAKKASKKSGSAKATKSSQRKEKSTNTNNDEIVKPDPASQPSYTIDLDNTAPNPTQSSDGGGQGFHFERVDEFPE